MTIQCHHRIGSFAWSHLSRRASSLPSSTKANVGVAKQLMLCGRNRKQTYSTVMPSLMMLRAHPQLQVATAMSSRCCDFSTKTDNNDDAVAASDDNMKKHQQNAAEIAKIIRNIKADLVEADVNNDKKIDAEELKAILKKYPHVFKDEDIFEIGEVFYTSRGGEGVSHERFMKAISNAIDGKEEIDEEGVQHRRMQTGISHPLGLGTCSTEYMYGKSRGVYSDEELEVKLTHVEPKTMQDKMALQAVGVVRFLFDTVSMWNHGEITQAKVLRRVIFLETVAGIPGFVAAMFRHFRSLRTFTRDGGMLNMFLDEANNERMHLLSFVRMRDPGLFMRFTVLASQTVVGAGFMVLYAIAPDFCHRFVGYVEEEACHTYTTIIKEIESAQEANPMSEWRTQLAPRIARGYWHLGEDGTVLDMMYAIRADEAEHRDVNHVVSGLSPDQPNPLYNPEEKFDQVLKKYVENMLERGKE